MKCCIIIIGFMCLGCIETRKDNDNPKLDNESVTFIINDLPAIHDFNSDIYISGNFEGWSGGREQFKLKQIDSVYSITIPKYREHISFKFTQGKWGREECKTNRNPIENRTYRFAKANDTFLVDILNWADGSQISKPSTASENVQLFSEKFEIPQLNRTRKISVYLPPNYETSNESYPVLYMQDGQNLFDTSTSYSGEWEVDETLNKLFEEASFGLIVVAIDHGGDNRSNEYAPWDHQKFGTAEGKEYVEYLVKTLKPIIDNNYRTKEDRLNTGIFGSSMGGLISHYAFFKYPDIFGKAGVFSPAFWVAEPIYDFTSEQAHFGDSKLYYLAGGQESETMIENVERMNSLLKRAGMTDSQLNVKIDADGTHSESFWKKEFEEAVRWLFEIKN